MTTLEYLRHFRVFEFAIFDLTVSFLGMYLLAPLLSKLFLKINIKIPKLNWLFFTLPIAIITHVLVGKITPMTEQFLDLHSHFILKIIIIGLFFLGFRGIKRIKK
ncbi:MAG: hypothetical protein ABH951_02085 [Patescibacteria group bacterium]